MHLQKDWVKMFLGITLKVSFPLMFCYPNPNYNSRKSHDV